MHITICEAKLTVLRCVPAGFEHQIELRAYASGNILSRCLIY